MDEQDDAQPGGEGLPYVSFNQLRSFHAVAITGSVTAAAKLLHVGQPTVTTQLRQLEAAYKVELAHRLPGGIQLTDTGRKLLALTEKLFQVQSAAVDLLRGDPELLRGTIRVGSVDPHFVMPALTAFGTENPRVDIDLTLNDSATIANKIASCELDVAVVGHLGLDGRYLSLPFSRQQMVLLVRYDHPLADRDTVALADLAGERLIMRKGGSTSRRVLVRALERENVDVRVALEVDREGVVEAVRAGLGVTVATTAEIADDRGIRVIALSDPAGDLHTDAFVVCLKARASAPLINRFITTASRFRSGVPEQAPMSAALRKVIDDGNTRAVAW
ncbi:LysR substrate-binding domain-containing protein [Mycolicibacterium smegmatis]|nr:LysR substrate-binding domain-containing protein [Mycolicibacterium smegmatis]